MMFDLDEPVLMAVQKPFICVSSHTCGGVYGVMEAGMTRLGRVHRIFLGGLATSSAGCLGSGGSPQHLSVGRGNDSGDNVFGRHVFGGAGGRHRNLNTTK